MLSRMWPKNAVDPLSIARNANASRFLTSYPPGIRRILGKSERSGDAAKHDPLRMNLPDRSFGSPSTSTPHDIPGTPCPCITTSDAARNAASAAGGNDFRNGCWSVACRFQIFFPVSRAAFTARRLYTATIGVVTPVLANHFLSTPAFCRDRSSSARGTWLMANGFSCETGSGL